MERIFSLWSLLKNIINKYRCLFLDHPAKQHSRHFWICFFFPLSPPPHISPDWKTKLPGFSSRPHPSSPLISSRLAWSVSECLPAITLSDRRTISESSVTPLPSLQPSSPARQGHPLQQSRHAANEEGGPMSPETPGGSMRGINLPSKEAPPRMGSLASLSVVVKWILIVRMRFDLEFEECISALITTHSAPWTILARRMTCQK